VQQVAQKLKKADENLERISEERRVQLEHQAELMRYPMRLLQRTRILLLLLLLHMRVCMRPCQSVVSHVGTRHALPWGAWAQVSLPKRLACQRPVTGCCGHNVLANPMRMRRGARN
jgi:uncharacterized membrane protein (DUF106 family)